MIRQLEVLAGYVEKAKATKQPVDPRDLEDSAIKDFVQKLDRVKQSMTATIEQLHAERDELMEEKNQAFADRDRALPHAAAQGPLRRGRRLDPSRSPPSRVRSLCSRGG